MFLIEFLPSNLIFWQKVVSFDRDFHNFYYQFCTKFTIQYVHIEILSNLEVLGNLIFLSTSTIAPFKARSKSKIYQAVIIEIDSRRNAQRMISSRPVLSLNPELREEAS